MDAHRCKPYDTLSSTERDAVDRVRQLLAEAWLMVEAAMAAERADDTAALQLLDLQLQPLTTAIGEIIPIVWPTVDPSTITAAWRIGLFADYLTAAQSDMASRFATPAARPLVA